MLRRVTARLLFFLALSVHLSAQVPSSDPAAVALAAKSVRAMTGSSTISDVTLTTSAIWIAGSTKEVAAATFMAKGTNASRFELDLVAGVQREIRNDTALLPKGAFSKQADGADLPLHSCWTDPAWFFPALSSSLTMSDPRIVVVYKGVEMYSGVEVYHLRSHRYLQSKRATTTALTERLSTMDFYLDAKTFLPIAITFKTHPSDDALTDISTEIRFADYRTVSGISVPFHIQKLISGGLALDVSVSTVALNSGLPDSLFAIQ